jgi:3-phosphoshikimate 1-carboxyvinyltransferase
MHERPQGALFAALRELGYSVLSPNDKLPAVISGGGPRPGAQCTVRIEESSQFASALLLAATRGGWDVTVKGENAEESSYVQLTREIIRGFPAGGGEYLIEPDASSASYFWGAGWLLRSSEILVAGGMKTSSQIDARFPETIRVFPKTISRQHDLGDSIMTAIVLAPFADSEKTFTDLGRLRVQECERVQALRTELTKCGARVLEEGDTLRIASGPLHGAEIETYDDHRMAMCFAMLGLVVPGMRIRNPECVRKTFPSFFEKLAQSPPHGLGVTLRSGPA